MRDSDSPNQVDASRAVDADATELNQKISEFYALLKQMLDDPRVPSSFKNSLVNDCPDLFYL